MDSKQLCNCETIHPGKIIGISIIIAAAIFSYAFYVTRNAKDTLSVTGSAKKKITSDTVKWTGSFSRTVLTTDLKSGYDQMDQDLRIVKRFFVDQGITDKDLSVSPVTMDLVSSYNQSADTPREYSLRQNVEVQSADIAKITALAKSIQPLINQGVVFSSQSVEYYYSKLPDLRVQMLGEAVKDAKVRADEIAKSSGRKVGALESAGMGVVQLLPVNSVEVSDYGAYDTSSIEKEAMVTVKTSFTMK